MTALSPTRRASATGVASKKAPKLVGASLREEIVVILAQANTGTDSAELNIVKEASSDVSLGSKLGYGSVLNLMKETMFAVEKGLKIHYLAVGDPAVGAAASASITTSTGTALKAFTVNMRGNAKNFSAAIDKGDDQDQISVKIKTAIDSQIANPFVATIDTGVTDEVVDLDALFQGIDGNEIEFYLSDLNGNQITAAEHGVDITLAGFAGGSGNPDTAAAIASIPETLKVTRIITQFKDTATQDALKVFADSRNSAELGEIIRCYHAVLVDTTSKATINSSKTTIIALSDARINDDVNSLVPIATLGLPAQALAEMCARFIASYVINAGKPPRGTKLEFNASKPRSEFWFESGQRDEMYKKGITNIEYVSGGSFELYDLCVQYHPADDNITSANPPIQFNDEDATAIGNMQFSVLQTFSSEPWKSVKFIGEKDVTTNDAARKLSDVRTQVFKLITSWLNPYLFIKNVEESKANVDIDFAGDNSERVNITVPLTLASTGRIYDIVLSTTKSN